MLEFWDEGSIEVLHLMYTPYIESKSDELCKKKDLEGAYDSFGAGLPNP